MQKYTEQNYHIGLTTKWSQKDATIFNKKSNWQWPAHLAWYINQYKFKHVTVTIKKVREDRQYKNCELQ